MDTWDSIWHHLPLEIRSPRGGGGNSGGSHSSGSHSGGSKSGESGSSSSSSSGGSGKGTSGSGSSSSSSSSGSSSPSSSSGSSSNSGSGSSSKSGGGTTVVAGGGGTSYNHYHGGGGGYIRNLPVWSVALITFFSLLLTLFLCALVFYCLRERKRSKKEGHLPRIKHALWKAVKAALFIWLAIEIWRCCCGRRRSRGGANKAGAYAKIDEEAHGDTWYGSAAAVPPPFPKGGMTNTAYGRAGDGSVPADSKYEPMGYSRASIAPIHGFRIAASPPPYSGIAVTPPTSGVHDSPRVYPPTSETAGEARSYYASMGMSGAYAPSVVSTMYEASVVSSAPTPVPAYSRVAYQVPPPVASEPEPVTYPLPTSLPRPDSVGYPLYPAQATCVAHTAPGPRYGGT